MALTRTALHAFKWSILGEVVTGLAGPVVFVVLARLLVPEDFGVVAAATVVISISQIVSEAGLKKALVQRQEEAGESANVVFWLNLLLSLVMAAILIAGAPLTARFFHDPRITAIVRVLSLQVVLGALTAVHTALLQKELNFRRLFWIRLLTILVPAAASIPLALTGMGSWALVAGVLAGQSLQAIALWASSSWRPRWGIDRELARTMIRFGRWAMLSALLGWFYIWIDSIVVGRYLGSHAMGLYRTGNALVNMLFALIFSPLLPVLYTLFSRAQHEPARVREALQTVSHAIALISLPLGFGLFTARDALAGIFFGSRWAGISEVLGLMALTHGLAWIIGANGEVYRAIGKPHIETWAMAVTLPVYAAGYLISVQYGLRTFLVVRLSLSMFGVLAHMIVARRVLGIPLRQWLYAGIVLPSALAAALAGLITWSGGTVLLDLMTRIGLYAVVATTGIALWERAFVQRLYRVAFPEGTK